MRRMLRNHFDRFARVWLFAGAAGLAAWPVVSRATTTPDLAAFEQAIPGSPLRWYKGNTHTHTLNSDGDSTPDDVVRWYREHGYQFLVLTDHNFLTEVAALNGLHGADGKFLVIRGEEVTSSFEKRSIHVNGLDVGAFVEPARDAASAVETIQKNVDAIRAVNGVPHINHPNFGWSLSADELSQVRNTKLFEVYNGETRRSGRAARPQE
jgi:predicted metal-dependent phosphoesterase TrpH